MNATLLPTLPAYNWGEACSALPLIDGPGLSLKAETMPPGSSEQPHYHEGARHYFHVQRGSACFHMPESMVKAQPGETLLIPSGLPHYISNPEEETLEFLVLSLPSTANDRIVMSEIPVQP